MHSVLRVRHSSRGIPHFNTTTHLQGLESHHMVMVMAVLLTCPHLKRLRLDGNKVRSSWLGLQMCTHAGAPTVLQSICHAVSACDSCPHHLGNWYFDTVPASTLCFQTQVGDAGAEMVALGLAGNGALRELSLARNALRRDGVRKLARALEANSGLRK